MKLRTFFRTHPVFTVEDFAGFLSSDGTRNLSTQESLLADHVKSSNIVRVRRCFYAVVLPGASVETYPVDPFVLASRMTKALMVDEAHLKELRDQSPRRPHYLEHSRRQAGRFVAAWNLVIPEEVYGRSWEK